MSGGFLLIIGGWPTGTAALLFAAAIIGQFGSWSSRAGPAYGRAHAAGSWLRRPLLANGAKQSAP